MRHRSREVVTTRLYLKCHFEAASQRVRTRCDSDVQLGCCGQSSRRWNLLVALARWWKESAPTWNQEALCDF